MGTIIFWVVVIFLFAAIGYFLVWVHMNFGWIGVIVLIGIVISGLILRKKIKAQKGTMAGDSTNLDKGIITQAVCDIEKLLALCHEAKDSYIGIFCVNKAGNLLIKAQLRDSSWAYAMKHENDYIGNSSTTQGEFLMNQFDSIIKRCNERHSEFDMGSYIHSKFNVELMTDWDDGICFEKIVYLPNTPNGYMSAIKSKVESSFPEYGGISLSFIFG